MSCLVNGWWSRSRKLKTRRRLFFLFLALHILPGRLNPGRARLLVTLAPECCLKMADSGPLAARRCDSGSVSSVSMETISGLTELEDLERVYQQLCVQEVRANHRERHFVWRGRSVSSSDVNFLDAANPKQEVHFEKSWPNSHRFIKLMTLLFQVKSEPPFTAFSTHVRNVNSWVTRVQNQATTLNINPAATLNCLFISISMIKSFFIKDTHGQINNPLQPRNVFLRVSFVCLMSHASRWIKYLSV